VVDQTLLDAFRRCRTEPATNEGRVACLVAQVVEPTLAAADVESDLQALASGCSTRASPWHYLAELGFEGNSDDYGSLDNSNLARVLDTRRGIPITLGVVLIQVARAAGRQAVGINFPGHFIVEIDDLLVDPFVLEPMDREQLLERLPETSRTRSPQSLFAPASTVAVGLRMLNNVKLVYSRQAAWHRTLDVVDAQLQLAPEQPALHLERGDLWRRLGLVAPARESFQRALELVSHSVADEAEQVRRAVRARLDELGGSDDVVH
jgi:regulator of sirC expression with transglutaminase-like and TPR domain